jgi:hypothetical protein
LTSHISEETIDTLTRRWRIQLTMEDSIEFLRFILSDGVLNALVEFVGRLSPIDQEVWEALMAEVDRHLRGEAGTELALPRHVFVQLPHVVQNLLARLG